MSAARYETLAKWVNEFGWTRGAELGVFDGRTFLYLLEHCPNLHLIGVDVWDTQPGLKAGPTTSGERCFCEYCSETRAARKKRTIAQMYCDVMESTEGNARARLIVDQTVHAAKLIPPNSLDFVFIDGDHSTEGVFADIAAWKSKVKSGGRLCGHDFNMRSVRDALWKHYDEADIYEEDDHVWWAA